MFIRLAQSTAAVILRLGRPTSEDVLLEGAQGIVDGKDFEHGLKSAHHNLLGRCCLVAVHWLLVAASDEVTFDIDVGDVMAQEVNRLLTDPIRQGCGIAHFCRRQDLPEHGPVISATGGFRADFTPDICPASTALARRTCRDQWRSFPGNGLKMFRGRGLSALILSVCISAQEKKAQ